MGIALKKVDAIPGGALSATSYQSMQTREWLVPRKPQDRFRSMR
jgi:hypothetical protein